MAEWLKAPGCKFGTRWVNIAGSNPAPCTETQLILWLCLAIRLPGVNGALSRTATRCGGACLPE